jgi:transmembrane E3 ubiquitin-protein ligase
MARHFSDLRELPSLVPSHIRNATAQVLAPELDRRIARLNNMIDSGSVETDSSSNGTSRWRMPRCFFLYPANFENPL